MTLMERKTAIDVVFEHVREDDLVLTTTGLISREVFWFHDRPGNFYMIGSMGLLSAFGLGLAKWSSDQRVIVVEGDGSALMSLGTLAQIAADVPSNLLHIILDNEAYESVGGQPTISDRVSLSEVGSATGGYASSATLDSIEELDAHLEGLENSGPHLVVVKVAVSRAEGVPRVSYAPEEIRDRFKSSVRG